MTNPSDCLHESRLLNGFRKNKYAKLPFINTESIHKLLGDMSPVPPVSAPMVLWIESTVDSLTVRLIVFAAVCICRLSRTESVSTVVTVRPPPRPSPGRVNYNSDDDDDQKTSADSSTLSDKASELSTARSQVERDLSVLACVYVW